MNCSTDSKQLEVRKQWNIRTVRKFFCFSSIVELLKVPIGKDDMLSTVNTNTSGKKQVTGVQRNSDCINKQDEATKERCLGKTIQKVTTRIKCINSLGKEHQCWQRHHFAGVPSESVFQGVLKATYLLLQPPKSSGVSHVLNPPSSAPASHLLSSSATTTSDTSCHSYFLFLYLITTITVFCQQPRSSPLSLLQNNSDQAERHPSTHHLLLN